MVKRDKNNFKEPLAVRVLYNIVFYFVILSLFIAGIISIINQNWISLFVCILIFILTFIPKALEKRFKIDFPLEFEIWIIIFIYTTLFLGEIYSFYYRFWWWDIFIHISSAVAFGFIGFMILFILDRSTKIKAPPLILALFSLSFALAIGATWEIFEFSSDTLFDLNMQKSGLIDTMSDLIVDLIGGLIASVIGYFYLKSEKDSLFTRLITSFVKLNPRFFKN
jgi:hypothetical protein